VIYVNAGAIHPADIWLDRLNDGGRLILPLTAQKTLPPGSAVRLLGMVRYSELNASVMTILPNGSPRSVSTRVKEVAMMHRKLLLTALSTYRELNGTTQK
jgi:protein-L-isoaspartate O-methyltransferase